MRRMGLFLVAVALVLLVLPAATQPPAPSVGRSFWVKPKPGMEQQFEEAVKKHIAWHRQQKDTWSYTAYQVEAGEDLSQYVVVTSGHRWEDFDGRTAFDAADEADYLANVAPYAQSIGSIFSIFRAEVSRPLPGGEIAPLSVAIRTHLNPGTTGDFTYAVRKFHEAIGKTNWPVNYVWLERVSGSEVPTFVLLLPRKNWAAFNPLEKPLAAVLEEAYGRQEAEALLSKYYKTIHCQTSIILRHRPDLSYVPAAP